MIVIGVDPGKKGGLAKLLASKYGVAIDTIPMPEDLRAFRDWIDKRTTNHVFIEKAQSFPGQGIVSAFNYGQHFGELLGMLHDVPHTLVSPRTWTKEIHAGTSGDDPKEKSLEAARRIFPATNFLASAKCKKPHDGMIDAALIAEYGLRKLWGKM